MMAISLDALVHIARKHDFYFFCVVVIRKLSHPTSTRPADSMYNLGVL